MAHPYFKARWNKAVGYVQASAMLTIEQHQEALKGNNKTAYHKYVNVNTHPCLAFVIQVATESGLDILLHVHSMTQQKHIYQFHLDNLPSMTEWDTIEFKGLTSQDLKALGKREWDDYLPCPQPYLDAVASQEDQEAAPEDW